MIPEEEKTAPASEPEKEASVTDATPNRNAAAIREYLDTDKKGKAKKVGSSTLAGRQTVILAVVLAVVLLLILLYFTVVKPLIDEKKQEQGQEKEKLELIDGEVETSVGTIGMFETVNSSGITSLSIRNENGEWGYAFDEKSGVFYPIGYQKTLKICDTSTATTMMYQFGYASAKARVEAGTGIDYGKYGLGEGDLTRDCTVVTRDGHTRVVTIGAETPGGSGFYARVSYDGKPRDAVYIVASTLGDCVKMNVVDLMAPIVTMPYPNEDYQPVRFVVRKNGLTFVDIRQLTEEEIRETESAKTLRVTTANGIEYDSSVAFSSFLYDVIRPGINGTRVVAISGDDEELSPEELEKWGIHLPVGEDGEGRQPYMDVGIYKDEIWQNLLFSEKTENDTYYVYVMYFDMVVEIDADKVEFLTWGEKDYIEASIYLLSIFNMTDMTVDSSALPDAYVKAGVPRVKERFDLTSKLTTAADGSNTYVLTDVTYGDKKTPIPTPRASKLTGIANFKHYFMVLMTVGVQLDVPADVLEQIDMDAPDVTITIHTVRDQEHILRFYFYNSRHAYYTLDGKGRFYVVYDEVTKFLKDTVLVTGGEEVQWESKNNNDVDVNDDGGGEIVKPSDDTERDEEKKLPRPVIVIIIIAAVLVVGGVGGFAVYAVTRKKKKADGK